MPIRTIEGFVPQRQSKPIKPLVLILLCYLGIQGLVFIGYLAIVKAYGLIIGLTGIAILSLTVYLFRRFRKAPPLPDLIPHVFQYELLRPTAKWNIQINVEWSPYFDARWADEKDSPYAKFQNSNPTQDKFKLDIQVALNRFVDSEPNKPNHEAIEAAISPSITFLQDSMRIPIVKYDCVDLRVLSTAPPLPPPIDDTPLPIGAEYPLNPPIK